jgi:hypothetical protein
VLAACSHSGESRATLLEPYVGQLRTIDVTVEGRPARMLFDTGAGISALTPEFAARIGCTPQAVITGFRMNGERVEFGRCGRVHVEVAGMQAVSEIGVFDLGAVLPDDLPQVDGILGLDIFDGRVISIGRGLSEVRVEDRASVSRQTRGIGGARLRLAREAGGEGLSVFVPARTSRGDAWLLLDSGNLRGILLHPWVFAALEMPAASGTILLDVEGAAPIDVEVEVNPELIYDGTIGATFLSQYQVIIDLERELIWWRAEDPPRSP